MATRMLPACISIFGKRYAVEFSDVCGSGQFTVGKDRIRISEDDSGDALEETFARAVIHAAWNDSDLPIDSAHSRLAARALIGAGFHLKT